MRFSRGKAFPPCAAWQGGVKKVEHGPSMSSLCLKNTLIQAHFYIGIFKTRFYD